MCIKCSIYRKGYRSQRSFQPDDIVYEYSLFIPGTRPDENMMVKVMPTLKRDKQKPCFSLYPVMHVYIRKGFDPSKSELEPYEKEVFVPEYFVELISKMPSSKNELEEALRKEHISILKIPEACVVEFSII